MGRKGREMITRHKTVGEMLKDRRTDLGHSQSAAARQVKVSRQIYPTWESGHALPGEVWLPAIAEYLDVDEDRLVLQRYHEKLERAKGVYVGSFSPSLAMAS